MMKIKLALTGHIFLCTILTSFGQVKNEVQFFSYHLSQYQQPIKRANGEYEAYFKNMGESRERGKIIINEATKMFTIKWVNGDNWIAKFKKKEAREEHDALLGDVIKTTYAGKWIDENTDCIFVITETNSYGCIATLKSQKVIDLDYGIDTWKKTFVFGVRGQCF